ncbi:MAG: signal peptidase I [Actinomycetota bacterium]
MRRLATSPTARRLRRAADRVALGLLVAVALALVAVVVALLGGLRPFVVRSGSMAPAIDTGDVVVTRPVHPAQVDHGDIVTFRDPSRSETLVTHRVVHVRRDGDQYSFVTKGDANTGTEQWSVAAEGTVGARVLRIPKVGYLVTKLAEPGVRVALLAAALLIAAAEALRRIWSRPPIRWRLGALSDLLDPSSPDRWAGARRGAGA